MLVRSAYALIGSLAALNRVWFSTFELKHERRFLERLEIAPPDFADRLLSLFERDERGQVEELERLVAETAELVRERFPDFDVDAGWRGASTRRAALRELERLEQRFEPLGVVLERPDQGEPERVVGDQLLRDPLDRPRR